MPLFDFKCRNCLATREHFVFVSTDKVKCPICKSDNYHRTFGNFRVNVTYANSSEHIEKKLNPELEEMYQQIGREALNEDSKTLDNLFGEEKVKHTYGEADD